MNPFISIIMPVYNNEKYFPIAVESVLNQSFRDFELIIVDDGSTDKTAEIADYFAEKDERVRVIHQKNQWVYASFNNGIAASNGEYIFIVNSDDTINKEALQKVYDVSHNSNIDVVFFNLIINRCDANQNILELDVGKYSNLIEKDFYYLNQSEVRRHWSDFIKNKVVYRQGVYKADIAKKFKYRNDFYNADQLFNADIAPYITSVAGTSYVVYNHFNYNSINMNASIGKYYGYEHQMFNELHIKYIKNFKSWGIWNDDVVDTLATWRLRQLTFEIKCMLYKNCFLSIEERLKKAFFESVDDIVYSIALESGRTDEMERRVISGCQEILALGIPDKNSDVYFIYEMIECIFKNKKTSKDLDKIKFGVYNEKNQYHIGEFKGGIANEGNFISSREGNENFKNDRGSTQMYASY